MPDRASRRDNGGEQHEAKEYDADSPQRTAFHNATVSEKSSPP